MEDVIRRIISIEEKAQAIMLDAREADEALEGRVETEDKRLERKIRSQAAERCRKVRESEHDGMSEKLGAINAETAAKLMKLEERCSENKDKWVDEMVKHIIGG